MRMNGSVVGVVFTWVLSGGCGTARRWWPSLDGADDAVTVGDAGGSGGCGLGLTALGVGPALGGSGAELAHVGLLWSAGWMLEARPEAWGASCRVPVALPLPPSGQWGDHT